MSKNIVIFADGTGQDGGIGHNTNVYNLFNMVTNRTPAQVSYYDRGLGTDSGGLGMISGLGIGKNVRDCYQFLSDNFEAGDRIYLFGFSRGAATVRALSTFVHHFGILPRSRPELVRRAWRIYRTGNADRRDRRARDFIDRNHTMWTTIRFVGVWDSVAALGLPFKTLDVIVDLIPPLRHDFYDLSLSQSVEYARHALAIDDERLTFHPHLWYETEEECEERHLVPEDIEDIYLVAHKLKEQAHPVTKRLHDLAHAMHRETEDAADLFPRQKVLARAKEFDELTRMLDQFDPEGERCESAAKVEALRKAILGVFRTAQECDDSIYDPELDREFDRIAFTMATKKCMTQFKQMSGNGVPYQSHEMVDVIRTLNRMIIEEAYSLRPTRKPRIKQVWFPGVHTDVGGGYRENELAHVALVWMVREAIDFGLLIYDKHRVDLNPNATGLLHNSRSGLARLYRRKARHWNRDKSQGRPPLVHESALVRNRRDDLRYDPWILKTKYDCEPWAERLNGSIQFDDHHIWREAFWGWDGAFAVPWGEIERVACDEHERTITLHLKERDLEERDIVIEGCLPRPLSPLAERLSRRREQLARRLENKRLTEQDQKHERLLERLQNKVNKITLEHRIAEDNVGDQSAMDEAFSERDDRIAAVLEKLSVRIETLEEKAEKRRTATSVESNNDDGVMH